MRKVILWVISALIGLGLAGAAWVHFSVMRSPLYAIAHVYHAVRTHDLIEFQQYVDVRGVLSRGLDTLVPEVMGREKGAPEKKGDWWSGLGESLAKGLLGVVRPQLLDVAERRVNESIEAGTFAEGFKGAAPVCEPWIEALVLAAPTPVWPFVRKNATDSPPVTVEEARVEGAFALLRLRVRHERVVGPLPLDLKLQSGGGSWRVVEVRNVGELLKMYDSGAFAEETRKAPKGKAGERGEESARGGRAGGALFAGLPGR